MLKLFLLSLLVFAVFGVGLFFKQNTDKNIIETYTPEILPVKPSVSPTPTLEIPPPVKILENNYHIFQTFNNCGPAALSMALSYYGINISQQELGERLRPYQNPQGNNDDKSVSLEELAQEAERSGLTSYHRPNGSIQLIKLFITYDIPVITRTWTKQNEDIGHYRVVKGYNDTTGRLIQDDSLQNKNLWFSYGDFNTIWQKFNYEYLVLVPRDKKEIARAILGKNLDVDISWQEAVKTAGEDLITNPNDPTTRFNLSVALYHTGNYQKSVEEFEKVESKLPLRTLWYQIEPIEAYFKLGNYKRVFEITDKILNSGNKAYSEAYLIRGRAYLQQGKNDLAKQESEKAVFYNKNLTEAKDKILE